MQPNSNCLPLTKICMKLLHAADRRVRLHKFPFLAQGTANEIIMPT